MIETVSKQEVYDRNIFVNDLNGPKSYFSKRILFLINNVSLNDKPINKKKGLLPRPAFVATNPFRCKPSVTKQIHLGFSSVNRLCKNIA